MSIKNGARSGAHCFSMHVGIGSSSHCLFGASDIKQHSSLTDIPVKVCSPVYNLDVIGCEGAVAVDARIFSAFSVKTFAKSFVLKPVSALFFTSPQIVISDLHSRRGLLRCEFILSCQKVLVDSLAVVILSSQPNLTISPWTPTFAAHLATPDVFILHLTTIIVKPDFRRRRVVVVTKACLSSSSDRTLF